MSLFRGTAIAAGLLATIASTLSVYPHHLAYFNEFAGGPKNGHDHLLHSNLDWGQDLLFLKRWLGEHPEARPFHLAYYGHFDPSAAGIEYSLPVIASSNNHAARQLQGPELKSGWYAVSVNFLRGYGWRAPDGPGAWRFLKQNEYSVFQKLDPVACAGYSIYIYRIGSDKR